MLYYSTVEPATLDILRNLFTIPELDGFFLVGGTCLSLRYGHRISIDLDLFSTGKFDKDIVTTALRKRFSGFDYRADDNAIGIFGFIDGVKIDLIDHSFFKQIDTPVVEDGIKMFGDRDLIAMKTFAVLKRAQKKDFWDIAELLEHYSPKDFIDCYKEKYPGNPIAISIPYAISYFADADNSDDPISLKGQTWKSVRKSIQKKVSEFLK